MNTRDKNKILRRIEKLQSYVSDELCEITDLIFQSADSSEDKYYSRSEKWQSSDKGEELLREIKYLQNFDRDTDQISDDTSEMLDSLSNLIDEI
jgi:hypothetical protein